MGTTRHPGTRPSDRSSVRPSVRPSGRPSKDAKVGLGQEGEHVELLVDGIAYSSFNAEQPWSGYVWDAIAATVLLLPEAAPRVLLLGCAGGTALALMRRLRPEANLTAVEIDRRLLGMARRHFALDETGAEIIEGDGVEYLRRTRRTFDLVIDDIFGPGAEGLVRPVDDEGEQLERMLARTSPSGVVATNSTSDGDPPGLELAVRAAYHEIAPHRLALEPRKGLNVVLAGSRRRLDGREIRQPAARRHPADAEALRQIRVRKA